jgi:hypothetical protein
MKNSNSGSCERKRHSRIPDYAIEQVARCLLPDLLAFYASEEGQAAFAAWKAEKEKNSADNGSTNHGREVAICNQKIELLKIKAYAQCEAEYESIVGNGVTNESRIDALFDQIWSFIEEERFHDLFWKLVNYVETFDMGLGAEYRRLEELHFEGY